MKQESGDGHEELWARMQSWGGDRARLTATSEYRHPYLRPDDVRMLEECELPSETLEWIGKMLHREVILGAPFGGGGITAVERERARVACKGIRVLLRARALATISAELEMREAQLQHEHDRLAALNRTDASP